MKTKGLCLIILLAALNSCTELKYSSHNQPLKKIELKIYNSY